MSSLLKAPLRIQLGCALLCVCAVLPGSPTLQEAAAQSKSPAAEKAFSAGEIEQLAAPLALYPDPLVSQMLIASTYPIEIVQAERWVTKNTSLKGDALTAALEKESWDPSVKSLVNFPQVLGQMNEKLDWTQKLGDAVLAQQEDVMAAIQRLRAKAKEAGHLETTPEQKVIVEKEIIRIEPAQPEVIYVPTYNSTVVYGTWGYPAYPPLYYYPVGYVYGPRPFGFAAGVAVGAAWGYAWGGCGWRRNRIDIDVNRNINVNKNINRNKYRTNGANRGSREWKHDPRHRKGVRYRGKKTAERYKGQRRTSKSGQRSAYRGRSTLISGGSGSARSRLSTQAGKHPRAASVSKSRTSSARQRASSRLGSSRSTGSSRRSGTRSSSYSRAGSAFRSHSGGTRTRQNASRGRSSRGRSSRGGGGGFRRR
jgi:hypothetical protein